MGDYCSGTITIGGHIPAQLLPEFCALLKEEGVTIQHGDIDFAPTTADDIRNALNPDRHLEFYNYELRNGCYEALEAWLVRHHIGFIRWSGSCGGYLPEVVHYRKKLGFQSFLTNEDCQILIGEEQVLTACRLLEAGRPDSAYLLLRSATPNHLPALPPLTIGKPSRRRTHTTPLRGVLLSGLGGSGKSHFAKALGNQIGWPTLCLDFGKIYGGERGREGIVGSAEAMLRRALHIVDAMSPLSGVN